jgi:hypothetical protein
MGTPKRNPIDAAKRKYIEQARLAERKGCRRAIAPTLSGDYKRPCSAALLQLEGLHMTRQSYVGAIDGVLKPMGFSREGREWSRRIGTVVDTVDLQVSSIAGTTANLWSYDTATSDLLKEAIPWKPDIVMVPSASRIGILMNGYDRWWKNDPNGPTEVAEALSLHVSPFFEARRSLADQARFFGRAEPRWTPGRTTTRIYLALTLYRMGELEEACAALQNPPRTVPASWLAQAESVRKWLGCPPRSPE